MFSSPCWFLCCCPVGFDPSLTKCNLWVCKSPKETKKRKKHHKLYILKKTREFLKVREQHKDHPGVLI